MGNEQLGNRVMMGLTTTMDVSLAVLGFNLVLSVLEARSLLQIFVLSR